MTFNLPKGMQKCLSLASAFACGVFLGMCFITLIPVSHYSWEKVLMKNGHYQIDSNITTNQNLEEHQPSGTQAFPWSEFIILLGFTTIFIVEVAEAQYQGEEQSTLKTIQPEKGIYVIYYNILTFPTL